MQKNVNLLPEELIKTTPIVAAGNYIRIGIIFTFVLFFIVVGVIGVIFFLNARELSAQGVTIKELEDRIIALQTTEQRLFLLNDRLSKAKSIYDSKSAGPYLDKFYAMIENYHDSVLLENVAISTTNVNFSFNTENSSQVAELLTNILSSGIFKDVNLNTFDFAKNSNFSVDLTLKD